MTPQHQPFVPRHVRTLPGGDPTVEEYASAVAIMLAAGVVLAAVV